MRRQLSSAQESALLQMSSKVTTGVAQTTFSSLETLKLVYYGEDTWRLTPAGQIATSLLRRNIFVGEFSALIKKFSDMKEHGTHNTQPHDMKYIGQKIRDIFRPMIEASPEAKKAFLDALVAPR